MIIIEGRIDTQSLTSEKVYLVEATRTRVKVLSEDGSGGDVEFGRSGAVSGEVMENGWLNLNALPAGSTYRLVRNRHGITMEEASGPPVPRPSPSRAFVDRLFGR